MLLSIFSSVYFSFLPLSRNMQVRCIKSYSVTQVGQNLKLGPNQGPISVNIYKKIQNKNFGFKHFVTNYNYKNTNDF